MITVEGHLEITVSPDTHAVNRSKSWKGMFVLRY